MNILDKILDTKHREVAAAKAARPLGEIEEQAQAVTPPRVSFSGAITATPGGIIAEFKRRSPSRGDINCGASLEQVVGGYEKAGAVAVSVLTDGDYFGGQLADLELARTEVSLPLLRKDFIIDPYQICEARIAGADAVLLIASALTAPRTRELARYARDLSLEVLLEVHGEEELGHICDEVNVVGVNNRNLVTFVTDTAVSERLADLLPADRVLVSESGISDPETVRRLAGCGYRGFLMGENFMKQGDPARALAEFLAQVCS